MIKETTGYQVSLLEDKDIFFYNKAFKEQDNALFFYSSEYSDLLEADLSAKRYIFVARVGDKIKGAMSIMIKEHPELGAIANSLPYYGSNGGTIFEPGLISVEKHNITAAIMKEVMKLVEEKQCKAVTFITNPLEPSVADWMDTNFHHDFKDYRIGQFTLLPESIVDDGANLLALFEDPRPRNVRKAIKSGLTIRSSNNIEDIQFLYDVHVMNMEAIGGIAKQKSFFDLIPKYIDENNFKVFVAEENGKPVSAMLMFYHNKAVEYFTPATLHDYRNLQPSALIIFEAMKHAVEEGYRFWNWGGTWKSQSGVYGFKKKWGATDIPYYYYSRVYDKSLLSMSPQQLFEAYPYWYVFPFDQIQKDIIDE